ncbi:MAG: glycine--tRNA ligase subunit beta [Thermaerobacter sp.]|nr:glycine--tRNA ligase subunit beta [Thermaerobacter sp.]
MGKQTEQDGLVFEVGVEEIPSQYLTELAEELFARVMAELSGARLAAFDMKWGATPRRLVVMGQVARWQAPEAERVKGPALTVAYRDGQPSPALRGFAKRVGVEPSALTVEGVGAKAYVAAVIAKPVQSAGEVLPRVLESAFSNLSLPRSMRWGTGDIRFIRPVRWCLALLGDQPLAVTIAGIASGTVTYGNRTDHPQAIRVPSAAQYLSTMAEGRVVLDPLERAEAIRRQGGELAEEIAGLVPFDEQLLAEVTNLVEWPTPFLGRFDDHFLNIPEAILVTSMKVHQRYFPVRGKDGRLLPAFLGVRNGQGRALEQVRAGNEKVLRARLADADYFYRQDISQPLAARRPLLDAVVFHARLGTYGDKIGRVAALFDGTREWWAFDSRQEAAWRRGLELFKCDLVSQVVQEFPELQGEMGAIYAERDGEAAEVVAAIRDQYHPGFPGDRIPAQPVGQLLGLLDRIDTVVMGMAADLRPTGSEDPFGMRRYALAIGRLAMETPILGSRSVAQLTRHAARLWNLPEQAGEAATALVQTRLENMLAVQYPVEVVRAVLAVAEGWTSLEERIIWVHGLRQDPDYAGFLAAFKRMWRVIDNAAPTYASDYPLGAEQSLAAIADELETIGHAAREQWWDRVRASLPVVNRFFEDVLVMDPDLGLRQRRVGLLARCCRAYRRYFAAEQLS